MMYFLDFDRTLFDTERFITYLTQRTGTEHFFWGSSEAPLAQAFEMIADTSELAFAPGELAPFVYPDVPEFLRMLGNEAVIVTHGNPVFQKMKIISALAGIPRISALYVGNEPKGLFLAPRYAGYSSEQIFTDDTPPELESVAAHCPSIRLFEMRRDGGPGDGRWPVARSLIGLP